LLRLTAGLVAIDALLIITSNEVNVRITPL